MRRPPAAARRRARSISALSSGPPQRPFVARPPAPAPLCPVMRRVVLACLLLAACGSSSSAPAPARGAAPPDRFDAARAYALTRLQVGYGQRPAAPPHLPGPAGPLEARLPHRDIRNRPRPPGARDG